MLNPIISIWMSHSPGPRFNLYCPASSVKATTFFSPWVAVMVAPGMNWSAARTEPVCWAETRIGQKTNKIGK
jgi:hypothetical protein